ncbi:MAG: hypothetical protein ACKVHU_01120 [Acidimicrobiales bacterium]|jgi:hypothetical protein
MAALVVRRVLVKLSAHRFGECESGAEALRDDQLAVLKINGLVEQMGDTFDSDPATVRLCSVRKWVDTGMCLVRASSSG